MRIRRIRNNREAAGRHTGSGTTGRARAGGVRPAYEPDDATLTDEQLAIIRRLAGRQELNSISSTLL
jgi:hypothetical protein